MNFFSIVVLMAIIIVLARYFRRDDKKLIADDDNYRVPVKPVPESIVIPTGPDTIPIGPDTVIMDHQPDLDSLVKPSQTAIQIYPSINKYMSKKEMKLFSRHPDDNW